MIVQGPACFGYKIREVDGGWLWTAFDARGEARAHGRAESRAAAAAQVIRALAEAALYDAEDGALKDRAA